MKDYIYLIESWYHLALVCIVVASGCSNSRSEAFDRVFASYTEEMTNARSGSFLILSPFACSNCKSKIFSFLGSQSIEGDYPLGVVLVGGNRQDSIHASRQLAEWTVFLDRERRYYHKDNQVINKDNIVFLTLKEGKVRSYVPVSPTRLTQDLGKIMSARQALSSSHLVD